MIPRAVGDKIIVEKPPVEELKLGGVIIPATSQRTPKFAGYVEARVLSVGPKVRGIAEGDIILMRDAWGDDYHYDGRTITILTERSWRDCCTTE